MTDSHKFDASVPAFVPKAPVAATPEQPDDQQPPTQPPTQPKGGKNTGKSRRNNRNQQRSSNSNGTNQHQQSSRRSNQNNHNNNSNGKWNLEDYIDEAELVQRNRKGQISLTHMLDRPARVMTLEMLHLVVGVTMVAVETEVLDDRLRLEAATRIATAVIFTPLVVITRLRTRQLTSIQPVDLCLIRAIQRFMRRYWLTLISRCRWNASCGSLRAHPPAQYVLRISPRLHACYNVGTSCVCPV